MSRRNLARPKGSMNRRRQHQHRARGQFQRCSCAQKISYAIGKMDKRPAALLSYPFLPRQDGDLPHNQVLFVALFHYSDPTSPTGLWSDSARKVRHLLLAVHNNNNNCRTEIPFLSAQEPTSTLEFLPRRTRHELFAESGHASSAWLRTNGGLATNPKLATPMSLL